ncbi:hypothetical protein [Mycobacterium sp. MUNTM1]
MTDPQDHQRRDIAFACPSQTASAKRVFTTNIGGALGILLVAIGMVVVGINAMTRLDNCGHHAM